jgi:hypothetical protein
MNTAPATRGFLLLTFLLHVGCALKTHSIDIPYVVGQGNDCGEVVLRQVLQFYNIEAKESFDIESIPDLLLALRLHGLGSHVSDPTLPLLYEKMSKGIPVIVVVSVKRTDIPLHCFVPTRIQPTRQMVYAHDGIPNKPWSFRKIKKTCECLIVVFECRQEVVSGAE